VFRILPDPKLFGLQDVTDPKFLISDPDPPLFTPSYKNLLHVLKSGQFPHDYKPNTSKDLKIKPFGVFIISKFGIFCFTNFCFTISCLQKDPDFDPDPTFLIFILRIRIDKELCNFNSLWISNQRLQPFTNSVKDLQKQKFSYLIHFWPPILALLDPDPEPYSQYGSGSRKSKPIRIRIQGAKSIRIHMVPDPKHCLWCWRALTEGLSLVPGLPSLTEQHGRRLGPHRAGNDR